MKIAKLFLVGAVVLGLGLTACKSETPDVKKEKAGTLTLSVVPGSQPGARLAGDLSGNGILPPGLVAESKINTVEVWVFAGGTLEKYESGALTAEGKIKVTGLTVGAKKVVVVANAALGTQPTLAVLQAKTKELSQDISNGLVMTAEPFDQTLTQCEDPDCNTATVEVVRVNARVALTCLTVDFQNLPYDNFKLTEVSMFNVPKTTNLFGAPLVSAPTDFLYGSAYPTTALSYVGCVGYGGPKTGTLEASLAEANGDFVFTPAPTKVPYFFVNENDAVEQTFIVLKGTLWNGATQYTLPGVVTDADGFTYYRININATKEGYTYAPDGVTHDGKQVRNTQYNLCVTLKKAGNPTIDEPENSCLEVTVTVKPWEVVTQNVVWE